MPFMRRPSGRRRQPPVSTKGQAQARARPCQSIQWPVQLVYIALSISIYIYIATRIFGCIVIYVYLILSAPALACPAQPEPTSCERQHPAGPAGPARAGPAGPAGPATDSGGGFPCGSGRRFSAPRAPSCGQRPAPDGIRSSLVWSQTMDDHGMVGALPPPTWRRNHGTAPSIGP